MQVAAVKSPRSFVLALPVAAVCPATPGGTRISQAAHLVPLLAALVTSAAFSADSLDVAAGKTIFEQVCGICHAAASDGSGPTRGPNLFGLIGREAGGDPNFAMYSPALKAYGLTWSLKALDEFLSDPTTKVPGTAMPVALPDKQERAAVIAYLASLK